MSLKHFHLFFIACSLALMSYLTVWANAHVVPGQPWAGLRSAAICGVALSLGYLGWFVRRYKTLS